MPVIQPPLQYTRAELLRPTATGAARALVVAASNPVFFNPFAPMTGNATEANAQVRLIAARTVSTIQIALTANGIATTDGALELRVAGAAVASAVITKGSTATVTLTPGAAGVLAAGSVVSLRIDPGTGGTSLTLDAIEVTYL